MSSYAQSIFIYECILVIVSSRSFLYSLRHPLGDIPAKTLHHMTPSFCSLKAFINHALGYPTSKKVAQRKVPLSPCFLEL